MYIFEVRYNDVYKFYFTYDRFVILSLRNNRDRLERRRRKKSGTVSRSKSSKTKNRSEFRSRSSTYARRKKSAREYKLKRKLEHYNIITK